MSTCCSEKAQEGGMVRAQLNNLSLTISDLKQAVGDLELSIAQVTRYPEPKEESTETRADLPCELAEELYRKNESIQTIVSDIINLISRVEL